MVFLIVLRLRSLKAKIARLNALWFALHLIAFARRRKAAQPSIFSNP